MHDSLRGGRVQIKKGQTQIAFGLFLKRSIACEANRVLSWNQLVTYLSTGA